MNIKKIIFSIFILFSLTACGKEEEVYEKRDVKVDSVFDKIEESSNKNTESQDEDKKDNEESTEENIEEKTEEENNKAQVTNTVNLRQSPNTDEDNVLGSIPGGSEVEIIESQGEWSRISFQGMEGFVRSDLLEN